MKVFIDRNNDVMLKFKTYLFISNCKNNNNNLNNNNKMVSKQRFIFNISSLNEKNHGYFTIYIFFYRSYQSHFILF